jgi:putative oxidoreductase
MSVAFLLLRALIGALFVGHGAQKVLGKFGGHGPEGTGQFFDSVGIRPGRPLAVASGGTEMGGGALLALGLLTPAAAAALISVMGGAVWTVHREKGVWATEGGWEYNAVLIASLVTIVADGPGKLSLDAARGRERWGLGWALGALGAGAASTAALLAVTDADEDEAGAQEPGSNGVGTQASPADAASAA